MGHVLLTGATGFVGRSLFPALVEAGHEVVCTSRDAERAAIRYPDRKWEHLDVDRPETLKAALEDVHTAFYLVHGMGSSGSADYEVREAAAAEQFAAVAAGQGVRRIVYLGGVEPQGVPSRHLRSRLTVGRILREGSVPTLELRASMIIGAGSESWRIVRDLSARLPVMVLPRWLDSRLQPVAIRDVVVALRAAADLPEPGPAILDVPGPEILSARDILLRVAALDGVRPLVVGVPFVTPRLSSYWIQLVTRADATLARQLVMGLTSDLLARDNGIWLRIPEHRRLGFDEAALAALEGEARGLPGYARAVEAVIHGLSAKERASRRS